MDVDDLKTQQDAKRTEEQGPEKRVYVFSLPGRPGSFTNRILTNNQRLDRDVIASRLREGRPFESFSPDARGTQEILAHLSVSLTDRPKWAERLGDLDDPDALVEIYEKVMEHEAAFRGSRADQKARAGGE